ncbi:MAG TPA: Abi-alpha family protein, partial [Bryobacteraceae bacterium]|nr:Abi-alpha family protein [Bryobacteraceae bacterium]
PWEFESTFGRGDKTAHADRVRMGDYPPGATRIRNASPEDSGRWVTLATMEPTSTELMAAATKASVDLAQKETESFLNAVLGEPLKEVGGLLKDRVSARRHRNLVKIVLAAKECLSRAGVSPKEVPLKIIHPLLDAASLEEEPDLQDLWAKLLANCADPERKEPVSTIFLNVLRELTVIEAQFLDHIVSRAIARSTQMRETKEHLRFEDLAEIGNLGALATVFNERFSPSDNVFLYEIVEHFLRLGLLTAKVQFSKELSMVFSPNPVSKSIAMDLVEYYYVTQLAFSFRKACQRS